MFSGTLDSNDGFIPLGQDDQISGYIATRAATSRDKPGVSTLARVSGLAGVGVAGYVGLGLIGRGRAFNILYQGARLFEEASPIKILRTFRIGDILSLGARSVQSREFFMPGKWLAGQIQNNLPFVEYIEALIGRGLTEPIRSETGELVGTITEHGLTFRKGRLFLGKTGIELLSHAAIMEFPRGSTRFPIGYIRSLGVNVAERSNILQPFSEIVPEASNQFIITGGRSAREAVSRIASAFGTEAIERINWVFRAPAEIPGLRAITRRLPFLREYGLGVAPGKWSKAGPRLLAKLAFGIPLALGVLETLDYAAGLINPLFRQRPSDILLRAYQHGQLALAAGADITGLSALREAQEETAPGSTSLLKLAAVPASFAFAGGFYSYMQRMYETATTAGVLKDVIGTSRVVEEGMREFKGEDILSRIGRALQGEATAEEASNLLRRISEWVERRGGKLPILGRMTQPKLWMAGGAAIGLGLILPFLPGALVPSQSYGELSDIYSGKREVPIYKGRWWELGRSSFEGTDRRYYRPHASYLYLTRAHEKAVFGDIVSPLEAFYRKNFTYDIEREHYWDNPALYSTPAFADIPIIGPLISGTIGRLVKPQVAMHPEVWTGGIAGGILGIGGLIMPPKEGPGGYAFGLGEQPTGIPRTPMDLSYLIGQQIYRGTEMAGLWGYAATQIKAAITGQEDWFATTPTAQTAEAWSGAEPTYWQKELGGLGTLSEPWRRLYPHRIRSIEEVNPVTNYLATWLPGPGEHSRDFSTGAPYAKIQYGTIRLPGAGYEALHPELAGLHPEEYPIAYRYHILSQVAPYSEAFKAVQSKAARAYRLGQMTDREEEIYKEARRNLPGRKTFRDFTERIYYDAGYGSLSATEQLAYKNELDKAEAKKRPLYTPGGIMGRYWEILSHSEPPAWEYITPLSPINKLMHIRSALEDYKLTHTMATDNAFWNKPLDNFIKPTVQMAMHQITGADFISPDEKHRRTVQTYFDILKYVKYSRLAAKARAAGDWGAATEFAQLQHQTMVGVNPYTADFGTLLRAVWPTERTHFAEFMENIKPDERKEILSLVPTLEKSLLIARWDWNKAQRLRAALKQDKVPMMMKGRVEEELNEYMERARRQGLPMSVADAAEYEATAPRGQSYADWYREKYLIPSLLAKMGASLPEPDSIVWNPNVDLDDIKLRWAAEEGMDYHELGLYDRQLRELAGKPYINSEVTKEIDSHMHDNLDVDVIRHQIRILMGHPYVTLRSIAMRPITSRYLSNRININLEQTGSQIPALDFIL